MPATVGWNPEAKSKPRAGAGQVHDPGPGGVAGVPMTDEEARRFEVLAGGARWDDPRYQAWARSRGRNTGPDAPPNVRPQPTPTAQPTPPTSVGSQMQPRRSYDDSEDKGFFKTPEDFGGRSGTDPGFNRTPEDFGGSSYLDPGFYRDRLGGGQDTPDAMWDKYQARETHGPGALPTFPPHDLGSGQAGWDPRGMGSGTNIVGGHDLDTQSGRADYRADGGQVVGNDSGGYDYSGPGGDGHGGGTQTPTQGATFNTGSSSSTSNPNNTSSTSKPNDKYTIDPGAMAALANARAQIDVQGKDVEYQHLDRLARIEADLRISGDRLAYDREVLAETIRYNKEQADVARRRQDIDLQIAQLDSATKLEVERMSNVAAKELEMMKEAHALQLKYMEQGQQILMEQGQEAFKDWQARQTNLMNILGSALKNPWLQQLTGMTPPGTEAGITGGGNIQALLQKILAPYDYTAAFGGNSQAPKPAQTDALNQYAGGPGGGAPTGPGRETQAPNYSDWSSWSPFKKAAYRTDIEALGPGAWETQQAAAQQQFASEGASPDITPLAGMSASPLESIGQQMNANMFGQTADQWQKSQARQWSQAQAPKVKQNLTGTQSGAPPGPATASPESQYL